MDSAQLTEQFYQWELRGRGWPIWPIPVELEPPFRPFLGYQPPPVTRYDDGRAETMISWFTSRLLRKEPVMAMEEIKEPAPAEHEPTDTFWELPLCAPADFKPESFEACLFSLGHARQPLAFEVIGTGKEIVMQLAGARTDAEPALHQLKAHYPELVITPSENQLRQVWKEAGATGIAEFGLEREFMLPLAEVETDYLVGLCGAWEQLRQGEVGVLQILFQPVRHPWAGSVLRAVTTSDGDSFFVDDREFLKQTRLKLAKPWYAVVLRLAVTTSSRQRTHELLRQASSALRAFSSPESNGLIPLDNEDYDNDAHAFDLLHRCSRRSGMLLNSEELVSLVHLPSEAVRSRKLRRVEQRTQAAPSSSGELVLGENHHEGQSAPVTLAVGQRLRHTHIVGATGTGKSTLLLNMICQDIANGQGVGVLDPHGDLIDQILDRIPASRWGDVVLFDPADEEYPIGFNLLSAHSTLEKTLLSNDLVQIFRRMATSWGDQMTSVLGNAVLAFLESSRGGTLPELRRFLIDPAFRKQFLPTVTDSEVVHFWEHEYGLTNKASLGSLLTRLDTFLRPKPLRYVVGQRHNRLDFGRILNGQIFLAKLSQGLIGEENSYLLGSLLVSKLNQLAIARQAQTERRPFWLYLDEFHHFITPSLGTILTGARKYGLGLVLAHQSLRQLQRDEEVAAAVFGNTATRISFRVGDEDARKFGDGFGFFTASDLQNLPNYSAIGRMDTPSQSFNLKALPPLATAPEAPERRERIRNLSQQRYGTPRAEVEAELAQMRPPTSPPVPEAEPEPEKSPEPVVEPPTKLAPLPATEGKGGREHKRLQYLVRTLAQQRGWLSQFEVRLGEYGDVDILLRKADFNVGCEIALTTPDVYEVQSLTKRLQAKLTHIVILSPDAKHLAKIQKLAQAELKSLDRVAFLPPEQFAEWLDRLDGSPSTTEIIGEAKVNHRKQAVSETERAQRQAKMKEALKGLFRKKSK